MGRSRSARSAASDSTDAMDSSSSGSITTSSASTPTLGSWLWSEATRYVQKWTGSASSESKNPLSSPPSPGVSLPSRFLS